jgi:hypothetical protein
MSHFFAASSWVDATDALPPLEFSASWMDFRSAPCLAETDYGQFLVCVLTQGANFGPEGYTAPDPDETPTWRAGDYDVEVVRWALVQP